MFKSRKSQPSTNSGSGAGGGGGGGGGISSFTAKIAHTSLMPSLVGNKDLAVLQELITSEKGAMNALQRLAVDYAKAAEALKAWGMGEGDDLGDILGHAAGLFMHFCDSLNQYSQLEASIRTHLKNIRTREESLDKLEKERRSVGSKADSAETKLSKMTIEHKNYAVQQDTLTRLREEIKYLDTEIMNEKARIGDFKRQTSKDILALKFGGLSQIGEVSTILGQLGNQLSQLIPLEVTLPGLARPYYSSQEQTSKIAAEASIRVNQVTFSPPPSATGVIPPRARADSDAPGVAGTGINTQQPSTISGYPGMYGSSPSTPIGGHGLQASTISGYPPSGPPPGSGMHSQQASTMSGYPPSVGAGSYGGASTVDEFGQTTAGQGRSEPPQYQGRQSNDLPPPPIPQLQTSISYTPTKYVPTQPPTMNNGPSSPSAGGRFTTFPAPGPGQGQTQYANSNVEYAPPTGPPPNANTAQQPSFYGASLGHSGSPGSPPPGAASQPPLAPILTGQHQVEPSFSDSIADALAADQYLQTLDTQSAGHGQINAPGANDYSQQQPKRASYESQGGGGVFTAPPPPPALSPPPQAPYGGGAAVQSESTFCESTFSQGSAHLRQPGTSGTEDTVTAPEAEPTPVPPSQEHHDAYGGEMDDAGLLYEPHAPPHELATIPPPLSSGDANRTSSPPPVSSEISSHGPRRHKLSEDLENGYDGSGATSWVRRATAGTISPRTSGEHERTASNAGAGPEAAGERHVHYRNDSGAFNAAASEINREMDALAFHSVPGGMRQASHSNYNPNDRIQPGPYAPPSGPPPRTFSAGGGYTASNPSSPRTSTYGSAPPAQAPPTYQPTQPPAAAATVPTPSSPLLPPKKSNLSLSTNYSAGGPPSPTVGTASPRTISASAFRRPFKNIGGTGSTTSLPMSDGGTIAGPPYGNLPPGPEPQQISAGPYNALPPGPAPHGPGVDDATTVVPLHLRNKKATLPASPYPPASSLQQRGLPATPGGRIPSNASTLTGGNVGDGDHYYTPNEGPTPLHSGPGGTPRGPGGGGGDYNFPDPNAAAQQGGGYRKPPPAFLDEQRDAAGEIPDEDEFMRELEKGD